MREGLNKHWKRDGNAGNGLLGCIGRRRLISEVAKSRECGGREAGIVGPLAVFGALTIYGKRLL